MNSLKRNFAQIFKRSNHSGTKIILLGTGLAMGLILIAKIYFEQTYESFVPELDRTYRIIPIYDRNGELSDWIKTPGAIAPGIMRYSPAVENATRFTNFTGKANIKIIEATGINSKHDIIAKRMIFADSSFFNFFERKIFGGTPKQILEMPCYAMVSQSFAKKICSNNKGVDKVIGTNFVPDFNLNTTLTIGGVFQDFPKNSELHDVDVILSLPTIGKYMYDGRDYWAGNDRYVSFIRLKKGALATDVREGIDNMCEQNLDIEELTRMGIKISYDLVPLSTFHSSNKEVNRMCNILLILSLAVLVTAVLNYVLIAISAMVHKAKTIAVYKCYGATRRNIYSIIFSETVVHIAISILLATLIVFLLKDITEEIIGSSITSLLSGKSALLLLSVCVFIFFICGLLPGIVYSRIPVASAFRRYKENNRRWKHALLFVQFVASTFFISLLLAVILQYRFMLNSDPGYSYKNLVYISEQGIPYEKKQVIKQELARLPYVQAQSFSSTLPIFGASGNNIFIPGDPKQLFNIADMYSVDDGFFSLMEIPIVEGRNFNEQSTSTQEIMVSRKFAEKISTMLNWTDGVVGKNIIVTEHSRNFRESNDPYTICGVYENFLLGYIGNNDERASVQFHCKSEKKDFIEHMSIHVIKLTELSPENLNDLRKKIEELVPERDLTVKSYSDEFVDKYSDSRNFRDSIIIAGLVVLLITIIGLIGYSNDEINRRRSEIAVRKINGASVAELLRLLLSNIVKLSAIAVSFGAVLAYLVTTRWLEQFDQKIDLNWWIFVICALVTTLTIASVVALTTYKAANANPVENLKNE